MITIPDPPADLAADPERWPIGKMAEYLGREPHNLHFWERQHYIPHVRRAPSNGARSYPYRARVTLWRIDRCVRAGIRHSAIRQLLAGL